ncbi:MAG: hypothetical protein MUF50_02120 [Planctomycetes bacterium]|jgi:hypothetical protein|nr:hypothetical protein [Planctomycetota bacterium]
MENKYKILVFFSLLAVVFSAVSLFFSLENNKVTKQCLSTLSKNNDSLITPMVLSNEPKKNEKEILTPEVKEQIFKQAQKNSRMMNSLCQPEFNYEPSSDWVTYENKDNGFKIDIPYNENWGNKSYKLNPYDQYDNKIEFGVISILDGCSWKRNYSIYTNNLKNENDLMFETQNNIAKGLILNQPAPQIKTINGIKTLYYQATSTCKEGDATFVIFGKKKNYTFNTYCANPENVKFMEEIVSSIKFID